LKKLNKKYKQQIIESHDYSPTEVDGSLHWVKEWDYEGKRLIVSYSNKRAQKDAACRHRMIERLMKKLGSGKCKIKDLIPNYGTKKYITVNNAEATLNEDKIAEDESWDGLHGVITNIPNQDARRILARYKELWQIEEAFRINKHDLRLRPIYHWTPKRISAHVMICFIAYALSKQALHRLRIQQRESISFERLRNELLHVQSSILLDIETKKKYILPSKVTKIQRKIYQTFGLKRSEVPMRI
jgi:transposase